MRNILTLRNLGFVALLLMAARTAVAGMVIEVQALDGPLKTAATQPSKPRVAMEVSAELRQPFHARTSVGDHVVQLDGELKATSADRDQGGNLCRFPRDAQAAWDRRRHRCYAGSHTRGRDGGGAARGKARLL